MCREAARFIENSKTMLNNLSVSILSVSPRCMIVEDKIKTPHRSQSTDTVVFLRLRTGREDARTRNE